MNLGLALHNLDRVKAGLSGEYLGVDESLEEFNEDEAVDLPDAGKDTAMEGHDGQLPGADAMGVDGWQDKDDFEREQSVELGDTGAHTHATPQVPTGQIYYDKPKPDKEDRKQKKKEKRKVEQQVRQERLNREKAMADT